MTKTRDKRGKLIPFAIVAFFVVVAIANAIFVYLAVETYPGLETEDAYEKGLDYNKELDKAKANKSLGWNGTLEVAADGTLKITILDKAGMPLEGLSVKAVAVWPVKAGYDTEVIFDAGDKSYTAAPALPMTGQWEFRIEASDAAGQTYRFDERVMM